MNEYRIYENKPKHPNLPSMWTVQQVTTEGGKTTTTGICATASKDWALRIAGALSIAKEDMP